MHGVLPPEREGQAVTTVQGQGGPVSMGRVVSQISE